jgi:ABC-type transporter Mla subunit MlaD
MRSDRIRNFLVGLTMLAALGGLMAGIMAIGQFPSFSGEHPYTLTVVAPNAMGLSPGNKVDFNGVSIGTIRSVRIAPNMGAVIIVASIYHGVEIPANALAQVGRQTIGTPFLTISLPPPDSLHPDAHVAPQAPLPSDGTAQLQAVTADSGLIPKAVIDEITGVGESLQQLLKQQKLEDFDRLPADERVANISILVQRLDRVAQCIDMLVGSPDTQRQFHEIIANVHEATVQLKTVMKSLDTTVAKANTTIDRFGAAADEVKSAAGAIGGAATQASATLDVTREQIVRVAEHLSDVLTRIDTLVTKVESGNGTAARFVNDPRLYESLLDLTKSLKTTADDLTLLVEKWQQEGMSLNLK